MPVINVTWYDAGRYAAWLSRMTGRPYRLLTEAEWEYAARAGTKTTYYWGDDIGTANANCRGCGTQWDDKKTSPVGSFKPNAFGLYDMAGNVWQWLQDCYYDSYTGAPSDGSARLVERRGENCLRVTRGGSWGYLPPFQRAANRVGFAAVDRDPVLGFRLARTLNR
jgi:formylglycine-generating enzyme required for sulfatase activity